MFSFLFGVMKMLVLEEIHSVVSLFFFPFYLYRYLSLCLPLSLSFYCFCLLGHALALPLLLSFLSISVARDRHIYQSPPSFMVYLFSFTFICLDDVRVLGKQTEREREESTLLIFLLYFFVVS